MRQQQSRLAPILGFLMSSPAVSGLLFEILSLQLGDVTVFYLMI